MEQPNLVEVRGLTKTFSLGYGRELYAVNDVSLDIRQGEILGLVGESGCGKSTLGRLLIKLHTETRGEILFKGRDIAGRMSRRRRKEFASRVQLIFQDPYSSLNPRMTVQDIIAEGADALGLWKPAERKSKVAEWLERVGLQAEHASRYPHEFSGGQRQRIGIARALAVEPELVICDEPISALDVSVQAQVVNLLKELQVERSLTYLFIAHDLSMVRVICDRMAVMYLGRLVELGRAEQVYDTPRHPYTQALIAANPIPDPKVERGRRHEPLKGEIGSPVNPRPGCLFAPRCPKAVPICREETPRFRQVGGGHTAACHVL